MFGISVKADTERMAAALSAVATKQLPWALSAALNDTAQAVHADTRRLMESVFDRPTPYTLGAFKVTKAGPDRLSASVERKDQVVGKHYLETEQRGGARRQTALDKLMESRIAYGGRLWGVVPGDAAKLDQYGNWSAGERNQVLAVLKAMRDGAANETAKSRKRAGGKRVRYFVPAAGTIKTPGVYRRQPGVKQPQLVLLFVASAPTYQARLPFHDNAERVAKETFGPRFAYRFNQALSTAR